MNNFDFLLNQERSQNDREPLTSIEALRLAAQAHADDMRQKNYFSHIGQDGSSHEDRIREHGYIACSTGENIAKGQKTPDAVMRAWMNSPGHRENILKARSQHYGIGVSGDIWVALFAAGC